MLNGVCRIGEGLIPGHGGVQSGAKPDPGVMRAMQGPEHSGAGPISSDPQDQKVECHYCIPIQFKNKQNLKSLRRG